MNLNKYLIFVLAISCYSAEINLNYINNNNKTIISNPQAGVVKQSPQTLRQIASDPQAGIIGEPLQQTDMQELTQGNSQQSNGKGQMKLDLTVTEDGGEIVFEDVISIDKNKDECEIYKQYITSRVINEGRKYGKSNAGWEIENKLLKLSPYLDKIYRIKEMYIEGIIEPPLIEEIRDATILDDGKRYISREVEYRIVEGSRFKKNPYTWRDFLLTNAKKGVYSITISYDINKKCSLDEAYIKKEFYKAYNDAKREVELDYIEKLKKLDKYMDRLYTYNRLVYSGKLLPPRIETIVTPIADKGNGMVISEEDNVIADEARFVTETYNWRVGMPKNSRRTHSLND